MKATTLNEPSQIILSEDKSWIELNQSYAQNLARYSK